MKNDTWEDIYRCKSDYELAKIYRGIGYPSFEQKQLAVKILEERKFNFEKMDTYLINEKLKTKQKKVEFEKKHPLITFFYQYYGYLVSAIALFILIKLIWIYIDIGSQGIYHELRFPIALAFFTFPLLIALGLIRQFSHYRKRV